LRLNLTDCISAAVTCLKLIFVSNSKWSLRAGRQNGLKLTTRQTARRAQPVEVLSHVTLLIRQWQNPAWLIRIDFPTRLPPP
jgi:hypothetical protein